MKHQCFGCDNPATLINYTQFAGTHYWCEQCVPPEDKPDCTPLMKTTHKIAYNYAMALRHQREAEELVCKAFGSLGSDNQIFALAEPIERAYSDAVAELLGSELFDWLMWWMYDADYGQQKMMFFVNEQGYDPTQMTLYKFLEIVDASN